MWLTKVAVFEFTYYKNYSLVGSEMDLAKKQ